MRQEPCETSPPPRAAQLREARRRSGAGIPARSGRSMTRRWRAAGSAACGRGCRRSAASTARRTTSAPQLARAMDRKYELLSPRRPVMEYLFEQVRAQRQHGGAGRRRRACCCRRWATPTSPTARSAWRCGPARAGEEQWRGTNAIGTALAESSAVVVHGGEHYLERNGFLTCAAAPIADPAGQLLGCLDISGDHRGYHRHTLGLVRSAARMIEHRLFDTCHGARAAAAPARASRGHRHRGRRPAGAVTEDGWIIGANRKALELLGLQARHRRGTPRPAAAALRLATLLAWPGSATRAPHACAGTAARSGQPAVCCAWCSACRCARAPQRPPDGPARGRCAGRAGHRRRRHGALPPIKRAGACWTSRSRCCCTANPASARRCSRGLHASGRAATALRRGQLRGAARDADRGRAVRLPPGAFTGASRDGAPGRCARPTAARCSWTRSATCRWPCRRGCCACCRSARCAAGRRQAGGGGLPLVCATHRRCATEVDAGRFREDLYYRVNGLALSLPPLRERSDLARWCSDAATRSRPRPRRCAGARGGRLRAHRWPGNLRQLNNVLRTACALLDDEETVIDWAHLPDDLAQANAPTGALSVSCRPRVAGGLPG
jgi:hypothetical protein